jgi:RHS repeat-associated protein
VTSTTYDPLAAGASRTTTFAYDGSGNLVSRTNAADETTEFAFNEFDERTAVTDPLEHTTSYGYDEAGQLVSETDPLGNTTTWAYDNDGRKASMVSPRGNASGANPADYTTSYGYDADGNLTLETDPLGHETSWVYDAAGRKTSETDANEHTTSWGYDQLDRLTSVTDPLLHETTYEYDEVSNLTGRTDANTHETTYGYDLAKRLTSLVRPGPSTGQTRVWTYVYDADGNKTKQTDANGNATSGNPNDGITEWVYDPLGRLTAIVYADATPDVSFTYDPYGNRATMDDGQTADESYGYDADDRLTGVTRGSDSFAYEYDDAGRLTERTYPDGTVTGLGYDDANRLTSVTVDANTVASYGYDEDSNPTTTTLPAGNGYVATASYDRAGRLQELHNTKASSDLSSFLYSRDPVGNPTAITTVAGVEQYSYDEKDQLTGVCYQASPCGPSDPFIGWTYDPVGNRLSEARPGASVDYDYNEADQLTQVDDGSTVTSYGYDQNGNQTASGSTTYGYDLADRLTSVDDGTTVTAYSYDGDGKRLQQAIGGGATTNYVWDRNAGLYQLALERDGSGGLIRRYHHGRDLISMRSGGADHYYLYDGLGSTSNLVDASGDPQWTYEYEPFGSERSTTQDDPSAPANPMQYTGEYHNSTTGLYDLRAREYDANIGRFLSQDPVAQQVTDPYVADHIYVENQPTSRIDPSGMFFKELWDSSKCWIGGDCGSRQAQQIRDETLRAATEIAPYTPYVGPALSLYDAVEALKRGDFAGAASSMAAAAGGRYVKGTAKAMSAASRITRAGKSRTKVDKWEVGSFDDIRRRSKGDDLHAHHVPQKHVAKQNVPGYVDKNGPAIAVPEELHRKIPGVKGVSNASPRDQLAKGSIRSPPDRRSEQKPEGTYRREQEPLSTVLRQERLTERHISK